jgi:hypothetical protein
MKQILHSYKLRLTNLSQGNRALKLGRLSKRMDIDLKQLGLLEKETAEELLQKIIQGRQTRIIHKLDPRFEPVNLADKRLNNVFRQVSTLFEETGAYDLFVGYPFVEGRFADGTIARCPVLLFPVRLVRDLQRKPRWRIDPVEDEPITFNKTFFLAYEQFQQSRLEEGFWEEEIDHSTDWREWLNELYEKIKSYELEVNFNPRLYDLKLEAFPDLDKTGMEAFRNGQLKFMPYAVLGIFPQSDSALLQDYETLEKNAGQFDLDTYFSPESVHSPLAQEKPDSYIREENRYFVTQVDQSQEEALLRIKQGNSLVIHGPPGTGKSQVIVNIIADAMAHGKRILLVSQKRAALDVVYKRLSALGLGRFSVLVHDYRYDRKAIYQKIRQQIDDIPVFQQDIRDLNVTRWEHDYKLLSRQVDQYSREFEALFQSLTVARETGMRLHDLYLNSDPSAEILPLASVAREMDETRLESFLTRLAAVLDYADFFDPEYSWKYRLSFHHYSFDDRHTIAGKLDGIAAQLLRLHEAYTPLRGLAPDLLEVEKNLARIETYQKADEILKSRVKRKDVEALHRDRLEAAFVGEKLDLLDDLLGEMAEFQLIDQLSWGLSLELKDHLAVYDKLKEKGSRFFSLKFLRARWFIRRVLKEKGLEPEGPHYNRLKSETECFRQFWSQYVELHEKEFFSDMPVQESLSQKRRWLDTKYLHLDAYRFLNEIPHLPDLGPVFTYDKLEETKWADSMKQIRQLEAFNRSLSETYGGWALLLSRQQREQLLPGIRESQSAGPFLEKLQSDFQRDFSELRSLDSVLANFSSIEKLALDLLEPWISPGSLPEKLTAKVRNSIYFHWIEQAERQHPELMEVSTRGFDRKRADYRQKLDERRTRVTELIRRRIKENICGIIEYNRLKNPVTYRKIYHQVSKKRRIWSVRKLVAESWEDGLKELVPCWMASPESTAAIFPMIRDFFDVIIFDEASQCFVERAIPVMLRGRQCVIAGDNQQLQPLDLYTVKFEEAEAEFAESEIALEVESILDLAKTVMPERRLNWHYRSRQAELINFSNYAFYEGRLQMVEPAQKDLLNQPALEWISVEGKWQSNRNLPEAGRIIRLLLELMKREDKPSIGIVTFNYHQQELIKDLLDETLEKLATTDEALYLRLQECLNQTENEEFQGLFVKNIENVQGDERDIIIFSIGYARNAEGRLVTHFGLLNLAGGGNRLNVAISRARRKIYVVCSFAPGELNVAQALHEGPRLLKGYLEYVKAVSDKREADARFVLHRQTESETQQPTSNPIADALEIAIRKAGFYTVRDFGDTSYRLDLAVKSSPEAESFLLGIECEGSHYFSGNDPKEREVYRTALLESRNWKLHRVWARNFWLDREKEIGKVLEILETQATA